MAPNSAELISMPPPVPEPLRTQLAGWLRDLTHALAVARVILGGGRG